MRRVLSALFVFAVALISIESFTAAVDMSASSSSAAQHDSKLDILFQKILHGVSYIFSEDADSLYLTANESDAVEIRAKLSEAFASREGFFHYVLGKEQLESNKAPTKPFSDFGVNDVDSAMRLMNQLFGDIFNDQGFDERKFARGSFTDGKLCSEPCKASACQTLSGFSDGVLSCFADRTVDELRRAFEEPGFALCTQAKFLDKDQPLAGLIHDSVRLIQDNHNQTSMQIDLERMHNLCFAPTIDEVSFSDQIRFIISKKHLIIHLKQILLDKVLLHALNDGDQSYVEPLILTEKIPLGKPPYAVFVIDSSGSLANVFETLKLELKATIDKVWEGDQTTKVRVTFFGTTSETLEEFSFADRKRLFDRIDQKSAGGNTRLIDTLADEIHHIRSLLENYSVTLVAFTDGFNNEGGEKCDLEACVKRATKDKQRFSSYTIGLGNSIDDAVLTTIARATCGKKFKLKDVDKFLSFLQQTISLAGEERLVTLVLALADQARAEAQVPVKNDRYGLCPSGIFMTKEDAKSLGYLVPEQENVVQASVDERNRLKLYRAFHESRAMMNDANKYLAPLHDIKADLQTNDDVIAVQIIDQFIHALGELRAARITRLEAARRIEAAYGLVIK